MSDACGNDCVKLVIGHSLKSTERITAHFVQMSGGGNAFRQAFHTFGKASGTSEIAGIEAEMGFKNC